MAVVGHENVDYLYYRVAILDLWCDDVSSVSFICYVTAMAMITICTYSYDPFIFTDLWSAEYTI